MGCLVNATLRTFYPWEKPGAHSIVGCVGTRDVLDGCAKSPPPPGFDPRVTQVVVSLYTG